MNWNQRRLAARTRTEMEHQPEGEGKRVQLISRMTEKQRVCPYGQILSKTATTKSRIKGPGAHEIRLLQSDQHI